MDGFQEMWLIDRRRHRLALRLQPDRARTAAPGWRDEFEPVADLAPRARARASRATGSSRTGALWVAGLANGISAGANGRFDGNNAKDVYARFDYKFGGMGLDGDTGGQGAFPTRTGATTPCASAPSSTAATAGHRLPGARRGQARVNIQDDALPAHGRSSRVSTVRDLNVFGAYVHGSDTLSRSTRDRRLRWATVEPTYHAWFTQADYVFYPWLHGAFRYETVTPADRSVPSLRTASSTSARSSAPTSRRCSSTSATCARARTTR